MWNSPKILFLDDNNSNQSDEIIIPSRGDSVWPSHIAKVTKMLIDITQEGFHDYPEDVHHYAYKSTVFALLELLLWYKNFIKEYN